MYPPSVTRPPPYGLKTTVAPTEEPVSLAEAKLWCRVDSTADDSKITGLITAARIEAERISGRKLCSQTQRLTLDRFPLETDRVVSDWPAGGAVAAWGWRRPAIRLPAGPVVAISSITYYDSEEAQQTLDSSLYQLSTDFDPALLVVRFPPLTYPRPDAVSITYTTGQAATNVPENIKAAIKMGVAAWYSQSGDDDETRTPETLPPVAVRILMGAWNGELSAGR